MTLQVAGDKFPLFFDVDGLEEGLEYNFRSVSTFLPRNFLTRFFRPPFFHKERDLQI
jgi:hypothetical protein